MAGNIQSIAARGQSDICFLATRPHQGVDLGGVNVTELPPSLLDLELVGSEIRSAWWTYLFLRFLSALRMLSEGLARSALRSPWLGLLSGQESTVLPRAAVLPGLKVLDPGEHVEVPCGILLNHILHVIRPQRLLEFFLIETEL